VITAPEKDHVVKQPFGTNEIFTCWLQSYNSLLRFTEM